MLALTVLLDEARRHDATDLLLASGRAIVSRRHGLTLAATPTCDGDAVLTELVEAHPDATGPEHAASPFVLETAAGRVRVHLMRHASGLAASLHLVPDAPPSLAGLALPRTVTDLIAHASGLVVVAGPRGSGRSSTLAALLQHRVATRRGHALTIESPIEFRVPATHGAITQRELGTHTPSVAAALSEATRLDVDTLLVADLAGPDTLLHALAAAEAGALVLGAVAASDTASGLEQLVLAAGPGSPDAVRARLAEQLRCALATRLVHGRDRVTMHVACEVLVNTPEVNAVLRQGPFTALAPLLAVGGRAGSRSLDAALTTWVGRGLVDHDEALAHAMNPLEIPPIAPPEAA